MGQWIKDLAAQRSTFADKLAERQSLTIPAEDPDYGDLGQAFPAWPGPDRDAILQPPKPQIRPSARVLEHAAERESAGGHERTVFYVGGDSAKQLWKWSEGMTSWQRIVPGGIATAARRFFVHPYISHIIYVLDAQHVLRSDDGGASWQIDTSLEQQLTCGGLIPIERDEDDDDVGDNFDLILTDMQFDPLDPGRRFAVGLAGAFMTRDGVSWERLLDTGALRGRPANCYFDRISNPDDPALYVSFAGRSIVKISGL